MRLLPVSATKRSSFAATAMPVDQNLLCSIFLGFHLPRNLDDTIVPGIGNEDKATSSNGYGDRAIESMLA